LEGRGAILVIFQMLVSPLARYHSQFISNPDVLSDFPYHALVESIDSNDSSTDHRISKKHGKEWRV